ncbi:2-C-methyl-D-erythritol 4-phosphate cytidylyltransferase [Colwellia sp. 1_MG-2023]|uniref:2-C-methyl-D-erythritol 4-phosphate cytidylyltransferase n=1 Tax=Colwellia sp. 1_MG-2023 TaxID=3062649 RepID=UPI0026E338AF|nr:2-C-methyl-D-erythritol 4-phosphate cytidylyltransferase [Colwellia sp. 1_MG-2023]MDO6446353.1 2-C-methyl-D-erythritol 4-phosphate cytidylyltransferase [Colwellia sp. 1_MG-2023]
MPYQKIPLVVVVPAAGVGKRMKANCPKQYLKINQKSILEHTVTRLSSHPMIKKIIIALGTEDEYFSETDLSSNSKVMVVDGGKERVDSVLAGLAVIDPKEFPWVLVHDAARPCLTLDDLNQLIDACLTNDIGGILASPVRDTMKRGSNGLIQQTIERDNLWHALTPQMYPTLQLTTSIEQALFAQAIITDEASAIEFSGEKSQLISSSSENIKITHPDDLALAEFILNKQSINDKNIQVTQ